MKIANRPSVAADPGANDKGCKMKKILLIFLSVSFFVNVFSQKINLQEAVSTALKNSLDIQLSKNYVAINTINNYIGVAGGLPVIAATGTDNEALTNVYQKINSGEVIKRNGAYSNSAAASLNAGILLYNGSRVWATKKRLEELERQSYDSVNSQIQNIMASVMNAYFDIVRQQSYIQTITQAVEVAKKKLEIIKTQQSVGLANNADLFQAEVDLNTLLQSQQSQQLVIDQAKTELLRLMTLRPDSLITVQDTIQVDKTVSLDAILNNLNKNGEVLYADEQVKINQLIIRETAAQRYPTIRASTGYNYTRNQASAGQLLLNQNNGPYIGISLNIPIYNGSIYKRQQKVASINAENAMIEKNILLRDYTSDIIKTYQAYTSTLQQLESQQRNFQLAQQLLDLVLQRFQLKQATIIDLTQAQQSFITAGFTLINYSFVAKSAEIELKRIANQLSL